MNLKKDIFPYFIVTAIVGMVLWMWLSGFPWGIILTIALLGIAFGIAELISVKTVGKSVSQKFWMWANVCRLGPNKYLKCPNCGQELIFPNKRKAAAFSVVFIMTIVIITVGHLLWK